MLEVIPVRDMVVDHAFNSLLNLGRAVLKIRVDLLLIIDDIMEGTEMFIVVQKVSDVGVVTSEELRDRLGPKKGHSEDRKWHSRSRHGSRGR